PLPVHQVRPEAARLDRIERRERPDPVAGDVLERVADRGIHLEALKELPDHAHDRPRPHRWRLVGKVLRALDGTREPADDRLQRHAALPLRVQLVEKIEQATNPLPEARSRARVRELLWTVRKALRHAREKPGTRK